MEVYLSEAHLTVIKKKLELAKIYSPYVHSLLAKTETLSKLNNKTVK